MEVPVTQFIRPFGKRRAVSITISDDLGEKVKAILGAGLRFTAEDTGMGVALCIENDEEDLACEIATNGPGKNSPQAALERMIRKFKIREEK